MEKVCRLRMESAYYLEECYCELSDGEDVGAGFLVVDRRTLQQLAVKTYMDPPFS